MKQGCGMVVAVHVWLIFAFVQGVQAAVLLVWGFIAVQPLLFPGLSVEPLSEEQIRVFWEIQKIGANALGFGAVLNLIVVPVAVSILLLLLLRSPRRPRTHLFDLLLFGAVGGGFLIVIGSGWTLTSEPWEGLSSTLTYNVPGVYPPVSDDVAYHSLVRALQHWLFGNIPGLLMLVAGSIMVWLVWLQRVRFGRQPAS